jgi:hypothetical protein
MSSTGINKHNVGRIAERIVANELEYRGFRVSDLNKEGTSANADLLAVKDGKTWQIQVKGSTEENGWWISYGYCDESIISNREKRMFNKSSSFYVARVVVLVSVKSPTAYSCVVLPVKSAEEAAQINLDREYRTPTKHGNPKKPGPVWVSLDYIPRTDASRTESFEKEKKILDEYRNKWEIEVFQDLSIEG